jgi:acyl-coenzyme A thioesterase PaaI-like protein
MVDVLAGALTARAVYPDWMATASLAVQLVGRPSGDTLVATGEVLRAGRTMAVTDVGIGEEGGDPNGPG